MKTIVKYVCEICGNEYDNQDEAILCENREKERPLAEVGAEVLYRDDWNGGFGPVWHKTKIALIKDRGHYLNYRFGKYGEINGIYPENELNGNKEFLDKVRIYKKEKYDGTEGMPTLREDVSWYLHCEKCGEPSEASKYKTCKHCKR